MTDSDKSYEHLESRSGYEANAKLEEVEALIQSRQELRDIDESVVDSIVGYLEEKITPFSLNSAGVKGIEKLYKKFDCAGIIDAIDISADKYLQYVDREPTQESIETFVKKIGGILTLKGRPPLDQKIAYVKGICRNRFNYWNEQGGTQILLAYVAALRNCNYSEDEVLVDFDEEVIPRTKTCRNWSQWRGMIESWIQQVEGWANDPQLQHDQSATEPSTFDENLYIEEKRKGGANSYQAYKPLRDKVEELCISELSQKTYPSANQLCSTVAVIMEREHADILGTFQPYQNSKRDGGDWKRPTFYGWCNTHYKKCKNKHQT